MLFILLPWYDYIVCLFNTVVLFHDMIPTYNFFDFLIWLHTWYIAAYCKSFRGRKIFETTERVIQSRRRKSIQAWLCLHTSLICIEEWIDSVEKWYRYEQIILQQALEFMGNYWLDIFVWIAFLFTIGFLTVCKSFFKCGLGECAKQVISELSQNNKYYFIEVNKTFFRLRSWGPFARCWL